MKRIGNALLVLCATTAMALPAQTFTTLYSFDDAPGDSPFGGLVQATDGNFYGTTAIGGSPGGLGTVFRITPDGTLTTLYSFCTQNGCPDGGWPNVGLLQATDGNFYGTTYHGGATGDFGTVFKMTPGGTLTTLHTFCSRSGCADGRYPEAVLVQGADEYLYGTTRRGGTHDCGSVFKITTTGKLTTLYSFGSQAALLDGASPHAGFVQAANGDFYGTTTRGGAQQFGTVFKISPGGALTTLYSFCSQGECQDGGAPVAGLVQDVNGNFYGTTVGAEPTALARSLKSRRAAACRRSIAFAHRVVARTAEPLRLGWSAPTMGTSTGQRAGPGLTSVARSSKSPRAAR